MTDMQDVDHTHPKTNDTFGDAFRRGPDVAADGGERNAESENNDQPENATDAEDAVEATMEEVDHTSEADGVDRSFERGTEGRSDAV